ncbi:MAG: S46 family peptidase [bacterium]
MKKFIMFIAVVLALVLNWKIASAEEGMWTLDNLPLKQLEQSYGFVPSPRWIEHVRLASVRIGDGGSGSFISPGGLVLTNHHVAVGQLQKMSTQEKDYVKDGFYAGTKAEEIKCPDIELNVLASMENVTERVMKSVSGLAGETALKARKKEIAAIEKESLDRTGLLPEVVPLYKGGEYWLYSYKKYRDVRLVFAPEKQIAFFGGDSDNFTYPRHDLDFALFRVYEDGRPLSVENYFKLQPAGAGDGELVFITGHPGSTSRLFTCSQLFFERDINYPSYLENLYRKIALLSGYSEKGPEERRRAATLMFGLQNSFKALSGEYQGLKNPRLSKEFTAREKNLRELVNKNSVLKKDVADSWGAISRVMLTLRKKFNDLKYRSFRGYRLPDIATAIVFYSKEISKPDGERLNGFHEAQLDTLKYRLLSPAPFYLDLEELMLADWMKLASEKLGGNDGFIKTMLGGKSPEERARELIQDTKLYDLSSRKALLEGGAEAVSKSTDPLIRLAVEMEPSLRAMIEWKEKTIDSVVTPASEKIAQARFKIYGKSTYPDATFTLRLTYGKVMGYPMNGTMAPPWTTFYGLYDRYQGFGRKGDWSLPLRFVEKEKSLALETPLDFVSTCDIIGGNSGSPVINRDLELVGLVFDGNIESLAGRFAYDMVANRAVSVHAGAILEALNKIFDARPLVEEIEGK